MGDHNSLSRWFYTFLALLWLDRDGAGPGDEEIVAVGDEYGVWSDPYPYPYRNIIVEAYRTTPIV
jgi:hypothetical protein